MTAPVPVPMLLLSHQVRWIHPSFTFPGTSRVCAVREKPEKGQKVRRSTFTSPSLFIYFMSPDPLTQRVQLQLVIRSREIILLQEEISAAGRSHWESVFRPHALSNKEYVHASIMCRDVYVRSNFWLVSPLVCKPWNNEDLPESVTRDERAQ